MILLGKRNGIAELEFHHEKKLNPLSAQMTRQLVSLCAELERDDDVKGVLLWGGEGRSFSVGGDFRDLRAVETEAELRERLKEVVASYQAVLGISKPVVAAIDHYAIGQGLQVALMCDWRIGSKRSSYQMPELKNGVACPLGSTILEALYGRGVMLHMVVGCMELDATAAREHYLIDDTCPSDELKATAIERLQLLCSYPSLPYRLTKQVHNERLHRRLEDVTEAAARIHSACFFAGHADEHFCRILGDEQ